MERYFLTVYRLNYRMSLNLVLPLFAVVVCADKEVRSDAVSSEGTVCAVSRCAARVSVSFASHLVI